jgi:hypothetical protein
MDRRAHISLWDLRIPDIERAFQQHAGTISAYRSWDASSIVCGMMVNIAIWRYIPREVGYSSGMHYVIAHQALQLLLLVWKPDLFHKIRIPIMLYNRGVRLCRTAFRFWPATGLQGFQDTFGYKAGSQIIASHCPGRAAAMIALIEPLLSTANSMFHMVPFRLHIAYAAVRVVLDISLVIPSLACIMVRPEIQPWYAWICTMLVWPGDVTRDSSGKQAMGLYSPEGPAWFVPAVLLILLGHLLPLVLHYWLELRLKVQFLRARVAQAAWHMPPQDVQQQEQQEQTPRLPTGVVAAAAAADAELLQVLLSARSMLRRLAAHGVVLAVAYGCFLSSMAQQLTPIACGAP